MIKTSEPIDNIFECDTATEYATILSTYASLYSRIRVKIANKYVVEYIKSVGYFFLNICIDGTCMTLNITIDPIPDYLDMINNAILAIENANKVIKPEAFGFEEDSSEFGYTHYQYYPR